MPIPQYRRRATKLAARHFSPADLSSFGIDVHAGVPVRHPGSLPFDPDLVRSSYRSLPDYRVENRADMIEVAGKSPVGPATFHLPPGPALPMVERLRPCGSEGCQA